MRIEKSIPLSYIQLYILQLILNFQFSILIFKAKPLPLYGKNKYRMKKNLLLLFLFLCLIPAKAQTGLSDEAQISILTAAPSDDEVYTVYGHTAIR